MVTMISSSFTAVRHLGALSNRSLVAFSSACSSSFSSSTASSSSSSSSGRKLRSFGPQYGPARFTQPRIELGNQYTEDTNLRSILAYYIPQPLLQHEMEPDLFQFGRTVMETVWPLGKEAESQPPKLEKFDPWTGEEVDRILTCPAWKELDKISAREGLVSIGYDREKYGEYARLYQFAKVFLFSPSSAVYSCPLAMTDGAARLIELVGNADLKSKVLPRLLSRDPKLFWTSGQWMTERPGGSDVSRTETIAIPLDSREPDGSGNRLLAADHELHGFKWFTSALDAQVAFALGRCTNPDGENPADRLSLFFLETRDSSASASGLNRIRVNRLKNKLGTHALPTAELQLVGTRASLIGTPGRGVASIANMINVTRIWNSIVAVAYQRRMMALIRDYATKRQAFGKLLMDHPLHVQTLSNLEVQLRGNMQFVFHCVALMGSSESSPRTETREQSASLLRILTPLLKAFTARETMSFMSEGIECIGGHAYVEDNHIAELFRDAQVLPIWEGTTNVQALDVLRVMQTRPQDVQVLITQLRTQMTAIRSFSSNFVSSANTAAWPTRRPRLLDGAIRCLEMSIVDLDSALRGLSENPSRVFAERNARELLFSLSRTFVAGLLGEFAARSGSELDWHVFVRWIDGARQLDRERMSLSRVAHRTEDPEDEVVEAHHDTQLARGLFTETERRWVY